MNYTKVDEWTKSWRIKGIEKQNNQAFVISLYLSATLILRTICSEFVKKTNET